MPCPAPVTIATLFSSRMPVSSFRDPGLYRRPPRTSKPGAGIRRAMQSTMQDRPLTITALFEHGARLYGDSEVVTAGERGVRRVGLQAHAARPRPPHRADVPRQRLGPPLRGLEIGRASC